MRPENLEKTKNLIERFIKKCVKSAGKDGVVIGLSGGLDSSLVAKLSVGALGPESVYGLILPESSVTKPEDTKDAKEFAERLGIDYEVIEIGDIIRDIEKNVKTKDKLITGNIKPRVRMTIMYAKAAEKNYLVAGTTNKSEYLIGYFTKWGDGAVDFEPILDIYKTQERELAKYLRIPEKILNKKPSAGLWKGQIDEDELGITYDELDECLEGRVRNGRVKNLIKSSQHKRDEIPHPDVVI